MTYIRIYLYCTYVFILYVDIRMCQVYCILYIYVCVYINSRGVQIRGCICTRTVYGGASKVKRKRDVFSGDRVFRCRLPCSSAHRVIERERERERFALLREICIRFFFFWPLSFCVPVCLLLCSTRRSKDMMSVAVVVVVVVVMVRKVTRNKPSSTSLFFSVSSFLFLVFFFFLFRSRLLCVVDCEQQYAYASAAVVVCAACLES
jgi:hypothetical protein